MLLDGRRSESSPVELAADPQHPEAWSLSVQVPPEEVDRFAELMQRPDPVDLMFRLDELERSTLEVPAGGAPAQLSGRARLRSFPHTPAGGSARFEGEGELRAA